MAETNGSHIIRSLKSKWMLRSLISTTMISLALAIILTVLLHKVFLVNLWWILPIFLTMGLSALFLNRSWKINEYNVASALNQLVPELEESAVLVLKPAGSLNFLEKLQLQKVEHTLTTSHAPNPLEKRLKKSLLIFVAALIIGVVLFQMPYSPSFSAMNSQVENSSINTVPEKVLPQIKSSNIRITPPAYTGKAARQQGRFNLQVEESALVEWELETNISVDEVSLLFNDNTSLKLSPSGNHTKWSTQKVITKPGFYQLKINRQLSELYRIEVIKDAAPVIVVHSPKSGTVVENGQAQQVSVNLSLSDDYGIKESYIFATIASGSGEGVKFKEQQIMFTNMVAGRRQYQLQKLINLQALGMQPGDELYFYVNAKDYHGQQSRSDIIIVTIQDTAQLMSMDGLMNGLNIKPEYFRSQRQIIIETEQLLKGKDTMSVEAFNNKSNDLGIDQKLLRLRYGKFLGEESNTEIGDGHDHEEGHDEAAEFGNAKAIMDQFAHKHDIAEDATFFDPETKKQLKATLAEMWNAEGKLRVYKPAEALPFEYKALRLLKDLQQKSRVYVAKTSSKTTPLEPAKKRLTGDLTKIVQPVNQKDYKQNEEVYSNLRKALSILDQLKKVPLTNASSIQILQQASLQLSNKAAADPGNYLTALEAFRRILNKTHKPTDIKMVQQALQRIIQPSPKLPYQSTTTPGAKLSARYFDILRRSR